MRNFFRKVLNLDLVDGLIMLTREQQVLQQRSDLQNARNTRDLIQHFLTAIEQDVDRDALAENLREGLTDLSDHVARLEEHVS